MDAPDERRDGPPDHADDVVERFGTYTPPFVRVAAEPDGGRRMPASFRRGSDGLFRRDADTALGQAVVTIGGALQYDLALETNASVGDAFQFRSSFKHAKATFDASDLAIASFSSVVDDSYPSLSLVGGAARAGGYANARSEYLEAIEYGGIDCLAAAHPGNLSLGVAGIVATQAAARECGLALSGLGAGSAPVFEVNGIRVAVLSYTRDMRDRDSRITAEGASTLLSEFSPERVSADVRRVRAQGAEFVVGVLNCQGVAVAYGATERLDAGVEIAESGADYVVCNRPGVISKHVRHRTREGREVPIATSLGTLISGASRASGYASALLRLVLRRTPDGAVEVEDTCIPVFRPPYYAGASTPAIPLPAGSRAFPDHERAGAVSEQVVGLLGRDIDHFERRWVMVPSHYQSHFTPRTLAGVLGAAFSAADELALGELADEPLPRLAARVEDLAEGCAVFVEAHPRSVREMNPVPLEAAERSGARIAIAVRPVDGIPTLVVDDPWSAVLTAAKDIRDRCDALVVAVTGTAGKTTTKDLIGTALSAGMRTLHIRGNSNTPATLYVGVQKLRPTDDAFVQEVNEGTPGAARVMSELLRPRIAVITSIADGHLDQMGTIEHVIEGASDVVAGMPDDGVLIVNNDNEHLRGRTFPVRTVRYGIDDPECDVYASDVVLSAAQSTFTIVDGHEELSARVEIAGAHNVSNALAAYAAAREAGVEPQRIVGALSTFRASSVRQHLVEHGGYHLLIDTYNSNLLALGVSLDMLSRIEIAPGARRIAVLGDMGEQGDKFEENHAEAGRRAAEYGVDLLLCHGDGMRYAAETAREGGVEAIHLDTIDGLRVTTRDRLRPGDAVLFKASGAENFTQRVLAPLFGKIV